MTRSPGSAGFSYTVISALFLGLILHILFSEVSLIASGTTQTESSKNRLLFRWNFLDAPHKSYSLQQKLEAQRHFFDFAHNKWIAAPSVIQHVSGNCLLTSQGDGNAIGQLTLRMDRMGENESESVEHTRPQTPLSNSDFIVTPTGVIQSSGKMQDETWLIMNLLLNIPEKSLQVHETIQQSFQDHAQRTQLPYQGTIAYEFKEIERVHGVVCAVLTGTLDIRNRLNSDPSTGTIEWKGTGTIHFMINEGYMSRSSWRVAKKTEYHSKTSAIPSRLYEIYQIELKQNLNGRNPE